MSCGVTAIESCGHGVATVELCSRGGRVIESWRHGGCLMASSSLRWRRSVRVRGENAARRRSRAAQRPRTVRAATACCAGTRIALAAASMRLRKAVRGQNAAARRLRSRLRELLHGCCGSVIRVRANDLDVTAALERTVCCVGRVLKLISRSAELASTTEIFISRQRSFSAPVFLSCDTCIGKTDV